jgi:hypothetical protein
MIQKPKRHGVILPRLFESNLVNQPLTIQDSALGKSRGALAFVGSPRNALLGERNDDRRTGEQRKLAD